MDMVHELSALQGMSPKRLREKYEVLFGEPTRSGNKDFLIRKIAWRMQAQEQGGLSERAKRRAMELANDLDIRTRAPKGAKMIAMPVDKSRTITTDTPSLRESRLPSVGAVLTRPYKGRTLQVRVLLKGFEYEGRIYRSLSAIAKEITGTRWNGFLFFGLNG